MTNVVPDEKGYTYDTYGRPIISAIEKRRQAALEMACVTFRSTQGLDAGHTRAILARAILFEDYIAGD